MSGTASANHSEVRLSDSTGWSASVPRVHTLPTDALPAELLKSATAEAAVTLPHHHRERVIAAFRTTYA